MFAENEILTGKYAHWTQAEEASKELPVKQKRKKKQISANSRAINDEKKRKRLSVLTKSGKALSMLHNFFVLSLPSHLLVAFHHNFLF